MTVTSDPSGGPRVAPAYPLAPDFTGSPPPALTIRTQAGVPTVAAVGQTASCVRA
jgi:hypothetical protein